MIAKTIRFLTLFIVLLLIATFFAAPVSAAETRTGVNVVIKSDETINDDLYLTGSEIIIDGTVNGDLIAFANKITINGAINGDIIAAGETIVIKGQVSDSVRVAGSTVTVSGSIQKDLVAFSALVSISPGGAVGRDLLLTGGALNVNGPISRNIKATAGKIVIDSSVGGFVDAEVGELKLEPSADIVGNLIYRSEKDVELRPGARVSGEITHKLPEKKESGGFCCQPATTTTLPENTCPASIGAFIDGIISAFFSFPVIFIIACILAKYAMVLMTGIIFILLAKKHIPGLMQALKDKPWQCLGWGAFKFFLVPVAIAILCFLIVGIPLGLAALALYLMAIYLSTILVALFLGIWILKKPAESASTGNLIGSLTLGLLVIFAVDLLPFIGLFSILGSIFLGLGMMVIYFKNIHA
ncbi:MAG: polymer-forming cytoskeletal protein [Chloroflexi bacterium]|nr:polymer-forming cytoskeletal protein [Chloroflexota bacterium]